MCKKTRLRLIYDGMSGKQKRAFANALSIKSLNTLKKYCDSPIDMTFTMWDDLTVYLSKNEMPIPFQLAKEVVEIEKKEA